MLKRLNVRKWANIFKTLTITLAPVYVPVLLLWHFGFRIESILASILFVQIYVLAIQAEAMLRQSAWSRAKYDPAFKVELSHSGGKIILKVTNIGEQPAYNLFIGLRDDTQSRPVPHEELWEVGHTITPTEAQAFAVSISGEELKGHRIVLSISYENVLGHLGETRAISFEGGEEFFMMPIPVEPGFLIKSYEDLMLLFRWHFRYKKQLRK